MLWCLRPCCWVGILTRQGASEEIWVRNSRHNTTEINKHKPAPSRLKRSEEARSSRPPWCRPFSPRRACSGLSSGLVNMAAEESNKHDEARNVYDCMHSGYPTSLQMYL